MKTKEAARLAEARKSSAARRRKRREPSEMEGDKDQRDDLR